MFHERIKHINVKYQFIRDIVSVKIIAVEKIPSIDYLVDMLTKLLVLSKFIHCVDLIS